MLKPIRVYSREALLIKHSSLDTNTISELEQAFTYRFYEDKACASCEWYPERHCDICDNCAAYKGGAQLAKSVYDEEDQKKYFSSPIGNPSKLTRILKKNGYKPKFLEEHPTKGMKYSVKFLGTLRPHQKKAIKPLLEAKNGILKAPPRSGKTVLGAYVACKLGKRTLILASQKDWLDNFYETFAGSDTQEPLTDIKKSRIGFPNTYEEFKKLDVALCTYQKFISPKGQNLLKRIRSMFPVLIVDEVHRAASTKFSKTVSMLNCEYRFGLSGTPTRKDMKHRISYDLIGPVVHKSVVKRLVPEVRLVNTSYTEKNNRAQWTTFVRRLENNPARLKLIAQWAAKDINNGHIVLIPLTQVKPIKALTMAINRLLDDGSGKPTIEAFHGGVPKDKRKELIDLVRNRKLKGLVGTLRLLSTGINIPSASMLYEVTLSSNNENAEQRFSRILTPEDGKRQPIVRYFLDNMQVRRTCMRNEWYNVMIKIFDPVIKDKDRSYLERYFAEKPKTVWDQGL